MIHLKRLVTGLFCGSVLFAFGYLLASLVVDLSQVDFADMLTYSFVAILVTFLSYMAGWILLEEFKERGKSN